MLRIYLSSTVLDLKKERRALAEWITSAGHVPVESYSADPAELTDSCRADVASCRLYVLLIGDRCGHIPAQANQESLSVTQMEYREARRRQIPCLVFKRMGTPDKALSDLNDQGKRACFERFVAELPERPAQFKGPKGLIAALATSLSRLLPTLHAESPQPARAARPTGSEDLSSAALQHAVRRSAIEGLGSPQAWFRNWTGQHYELSLPPTHFLLDSCFVDTGIRDVVAARLRAGQTTGIVGFVGMGGVGKTFTALRIAWDFVAAGWQVCWLSLLQRSADDALDLLAQSLGQRFVPNLDRSEKVAGLRELLPLYKKHYPKLLIVLDNAEQFPDFGVVLGALKHQTVLVTSRTPEQAQVVRYHRINPLEGEHAVSFCVKFLAGNNEAAELWVPNDGERADLLELASLYGGHPLALRTALAGFLRQPRSARTGERPIARFIALLKRKGLKSVDDKDAVYAAGEPSEELLRGNMDSTFEWLYSQLGAAGRQQAERQAYFLLPFCAAVGAASFEVATLRRAIQQLISLRAERAATPALRAALGLDSEESVGSSEGGGDPVWLADARVLAADEGAQITRALEVLERITLLDPLAATQPSFAMHPVVREFAFGQCDPADSARPSSETLLRVAIATLGDGQGIGDALIDLLPRLKGQRGLVEQACVVLLSRWDDEKHRNYRHLHLWATEVLALVRDLGLTERTAEIQSLLGELLDRMGDTDGLRQLHESLHSFGSEDVPWPPFSEMDAMAYLAALEPERDFGRKTARQSRPRGRMAWGLAYLAARLSGAAPAVEARAFLRAYRSALSDSNGNPALLARLESAAGGLLNPQAGALLQVSPQDGLPTNAVMRLTACFHRWSWRPPAAPLLDDARKLAAVGGGFLAQDGRRGVATVQHRLALRESVLGFDLLSGAIPECEYRAGIEELRRFGLENGIRLFGLESQSCSALAAHAVARQQWAAAVAHLERAAAAAREVPGHLDSARDGAREMDLLADGCRSLAGAAADAPALDLEAWAAEIDAKRLDALRAWLQVARACRHWSLQELGPCAAAARTACAAFEADVGAPPKWLADLLGRLAGAPQPAVDQARTDRHPYQDPHGLPPRVRSRSDGRAMVLVRGGIGPLEGGKQGWIWPLYIDETPLTLGEVKRLCAAAGTALLYARNADDTAVVRQLVGEGVAAMLAVAGKMLPTPQERFVAQAQAQRGEPRLWPMGEAVDRLQLQSIRAVLTSTSETPPARSLPDLLDHDELLGLKALDGARRARPERSTAKVSPTLAHMKRHWSGAAWLGVADARAAVEQWVLAMMRNPVFKVRQARRLAVLTLASISLSKAEKVSVLLHATRDLTAGKVTDLISVFEDERLEFEKLLATEGEIIAGLLTKARAEIGELLALGIQDQPTNVTRAVIATVRACSGAVADEAAWRLQLEPDNAQSQEASECVRFVRPVFDASDLSDLEPLT